VKGTHERWRVILFVPGQPANHMITNTAWSFARALREDTAYSSVRSWGIPLW